LDFGGHVFGGLGVAGVVAVVAVAVWFVVDVGCHWFIGMGCCKRIFSALAMAWAHARAPYQFPDRLMNRPCSKLTLLQPSADCPEAAGRGAALTEDASEAAFCIETSIRTTSISRSEASPK
jgi:hypothetical protein